MFHKTWLVLAGVMVFILGLSWRVMAQKPPKTYDMQNYEKDWEEIQTFENSGQTKSALQASQKLYDKVKADNSNPLQRPQLLKTLLFVNKYQAHLEEDGYPKAIARFEQEAAQADNTLKPLMLSMLAEMYDRYLIANLYKIQGRTATDANFKQDDVQTWDVRRITERSYDLYKQSLTFDATKTVALKEFAAVLGNAKDALALEVMPTLFDLLAKRAVDYFMSERTFLTQPAYKFYIEQPEALSDARTFANHKFVTKDALSASYHALLVFQELLKFHQNDKDPQALVDADLRRLQYVRSKTTLPNKNELYYEQLKNIETQYAASPASTEATYYRASYHIELAQKYKPSPTDQYRWEYKTALELIDNATKNHPKALGTQQCASLRTSILYKNLNFQLEDVVGNNQPALGLVTFRNLSVVHCRLVDYTDAVQEKMSRKYGEDLLKYLASLPTKHTWSVELPNQNDYQQHSAEIKIPAMPFGKYLVLVSPDKEFSAHKNAIAFTEYQVSDLNYFHRNNNGKEEFFVTHRATGKPLEGVSVEFSMQVYNSRSYDYSWVKISSGKTDKNGFIQSPMPNKKEMMSSRAKFTLGNDVFTMNGGYYNTERGSAGADNVSTTFFLDRAIYRPSQTVYFKGLLVRTDAEGKNPRIIANQKTTITFFDANRQEVAKQEVTTNEYGSYQGSFTAPASGMLGVMSLYDSYTQHSHNFRVEEYKRPKFEVTFKPVETAYKLTEKVKVTGVATAFAGNKIDGGKVQYRVHRQAQFPYWNWYKWGWNPYRQEKQEITFGETTTNENGEFVIEFEAIADKSIPADQKPQFIYTVTADVTDVAGETRSSQASVTVGYIAMNVALEVPEFAERQELKSITVSTTNLNGQPEAAAGSIVIERLQTPSIAYRLRYWEKPDYFVLKEADFKKDFPMYAFQKEDEASGWAIDKQVFTGNFDTKTSKEIALNALEQGVYKLTLTTQDKYGERIELIKNFTIYQQDAKSVPSTEVLFVPQAALTAEPETTVEIKLGSLAKEAYVLVQAECDGELLVNQWIQPNGRASIPVAVKEKHRGNINFQLATCWDYRAYMEQGVIEVPWSNKELNMEFSTFRDKLYPGQDEEWRLKISGKKGDKVMAEVLAGMYDASLDAFAANMWNLSLYGFNYPEMPLSQGDGFGSENSDRAENQWNTYNYANGRSYAYFNWFGFDAHDWREGRSEVYFSAAAVRSAAPAPRMKKEASRKDKAAEATGATLEGFFMDDTVLTNEEEEKAAMMGGNGSDKAPDFGDVKVRTNLNETVFFMPQLATDAEGNVIIKFKMNEALTKWKFMTLAHTKDLRIATQTRSVVTQKDLMVQPNAPRFFRQGDVIQFTAKISNLTKEKISGQAVLQLLDAATLRPVDASFANSNNVVEFSVDGDRSTGVSWKLNVPSDWTMPLTYRVIAKTSQFSDGEENTLPVISNRMLLTETQPLPIRGGQTKTFTFKRMEEVSKSPTMRSHQLTLEFTQNPAWYAVQSLPYLMEYPYECTEQIFSRFYANSLAANVANSTPRIQQVFNQWKNYDPNALKSNLHKNQELKYALLEETPWVFAADNEAEQKRNVGLLFDLNRMSNELERARDKMAERQLNNGGFAWFAGDRDNWYITQYIVEGMGHLRLLGVKAAKEDAKIGDMMQKAVEYTDNQLAKHYDDLLDWAKRDKNVKLEDDHLDNIAIHYLYARSFYLSQPVDGKKAKEAIEYYEGQAKKYWLKKSQYSQGMLALAFHRKGDKDLPAKIVRALKENSLNSEEMGMYWKYAAGYNWYEMPIETHALMIEVFAEVANDMTAVDDLKTWLLKNKQTTHWATTKATASACYALLLRGDNLLAEDKDITIKLGSETLDQSKLQKEAGTGYFKTTWAANEIKPDMAKITVTNPNKVVAWGAMYWQYFEQLDKVTTFKETPLTINKQLFKEVRTDVGAKLLPISNGEKLQVGDLVKVRVEIRVDRDMEYVHMKDMRASGFEPVNVLSQFKYQDGLGYYESTRDAATNFFFSYLRKGTYVFEYPVRVQHKGDFSNGVTTIQCMYAPEFTAHSEGIRVTVE